MHFDKKRILVGLTGIVLVGLLLNAASHYHLRQIVDRLAFSRDILMYVWIQFGIVLIVYRERVFQILREFFSAETHPVNLAIFRIIVFSTVVAGVKPEKIAFFGHIPKELLFSPPGYEHLIHFIPLSPDVLFVAASLLILFGWMAAIGLLTRFSTWCTAFLAIYVLGIPQLFGKIDHYHFLIWFALILASSPCGDALSVDAMIDRVWKKKEKRFIGPSVCYALPIRFAWILIGILYFFPGFWKFWVGGVDWFLSDNLKYRMYFKWAELDGWLPFFRLDQYPIFYKFGAFWTIVFEMTFIFLIFSPKTRYLAVLEGLTFHGFTNLFMKISFISLVKCYVVFFDWYKIYSNVLQKLGIKFTKEQTFSAKQETPRKVSRSLIVTAIVLIVSNIYCGFGAYGGIDTWPIACYPTFANVMRAPYKAVMEVITVDASGKEHSPDLKKIYQQIGTSRYWGMIQSILYTAEAGERKKKQRAFLSLWARFDPMIEQAEKIRLYSTVVGTAPDRNQGQEQERTLLTEIVL